MEMEDFSNFEYGEESNSEGEAEVDLENQYYNSKSEKENSLIVALESFQKVLDLQGEKKSEWGFKALKQIIKILFKRKKYSEMAEKYKELLTYFRFVTKNESEKAVNSILTYTSLTKNTNLLCSIYEITIDSLKLCKNNRLWFKITIKLGKLYCDIGEFNKLQQIIKQLYTACQPSGEEIECKGSQLLDIYALEIQMYTAQNNYQKLKNIYEKSLKIKSALPQPFTLGIIRECGGKMCLMYGDYTKSLIDLYEAFKSYDECGSTRRCICLKYLILVAMLTKSNINPLDSQDTKQYRNETEVKPITDLYFAYQNKDINNFEKILAKKDPSIYNDIFVIEYLDRLRKNLRIAVLLDTIRPYKTIKINFISNVLYIDEQETENLLVSCILDNIVSGRIDQINKILILNKNKEKTFVSKYEGIGKLIESIDHIQFKITSLAL